MLGHAALKDVKNSGVPLLFSLPLSVSTSPPSLFFSIIYFLAITLSTTLHISISPVSRRPSFLFSFSLTLSFTLILLTSADS